MKEVLPMVVKVKVSVVEEPTLGEDGNSFEFAFNTVAPFAIFGSIETLVRSIIRIWGSYPYEE